MYIYELVHVFQKGGDTERPINQIKPAKGQLN